MNIIKFIKNDFRHKRPLFIREHHQSDMIVSIEIHKMDDGYVLVAFKNDLKGRYQQYEISDSCLDTLLEKSQEILGFKLDKFLT